MIKNLRRGKNINGEGETEKSSLMACLSNNRMKTNSEREKKREERELQCSGRDHRSSNDYDDTIEDKKKIGGTRGLEAHYC